MNRDASQVAAESRLDAPNARRRAIPPVHRLLDRLGQIELPRPIVLDVIRRELDNIRNSRAGFDETAILNRIRASLDDLRRSRIAPVVNATGIIIHTNLGRSPLSDEVVAKLTQAAAGYSNLEYDLNSGHRGSRAAYLEKSLAILCAAPDATVVNNCAAALVLILRHFASNRARNRVIVSRGELVQIGGGFRIPEILECSGARLREVGTTNHTTLDDYRHAIDPRTAMILRVHRSNFYMDGFVESPTRDQLAALARGAGVPLVEDLGSGAVFDTSSLGNEREPTPAEALRAGVDLVCFSGDKLLGGPQAGIIAGRADYVSRLKREPFFRALRCDKLVLAALEASIDLHLSGQGHQIRIVSMMRAPLPQLRRRASRIVRALRDLAPLRASPGRTESQVGGGSLPRTTIPSASIDLMLLGVRAEDFASRLRQATPPIIARLADGVVKLDLRTVLPSQDKSVLQALRSIAANQP